MVYVVSNLNKQKKKLKKEIFLDRIENRVEINNMWQVS
jgi:hypothetical protein